MQKFIIFRIIADYCRPQKRPTIWIWVQSQNSYWAFGHFEPQHRFLVPKNCTILVCLHSFWLSPHPLYLALRLGFWNLQENWSCRLFWAWVISFSKTRYFEFCYRVIMIARFVVAFSDSSFWGATFAPMQNLAILSTFRHSECRKVKWGFWLTSLSHSYPMWHSSCSSSFKYRNWALNKWRWETTSILESLL